MEVDESKTQWKTTYQGKAYYFCSEDCLKSFESNPQKYVEETHEHKRAHHGC
jgi:Cu+-exporting ATPase